MVMVVADELEVVFECSDICSEHVHCLDISWSLLSFESKLFADAAHFLPGKLA